MKKNNRKGFTIVELVIVIAVIAILAAVLIPTFAGIIKKANDSSALQEARNIYTAYLAEAANDGAVNNNVIIEVDDGDYYFEVKDGELQKEPIEAPTNCSMVITADTDNDDIPNTKYVGTIHDKDASTNKCKVCDATVE